MAAGADSVKMMVSYGGEIQRCPDSGKARYTGGENRIVRVGMSERLSQLRARLAALAGYPDVRIRYATAAGDGLDTLRDVECEADLWRLVTLLYCCSAGVAAARDSRVHAFLFRADAPPPPSSEAALAAPARMRQSALSPSLLVVEHEEYYKGSLSSTAAAASLLSSQSAGTLDTAGSSATTSGEATHAVRGDCGFEALAAIAAEQSSATVHTSSSSATSSGSAACAAQDNRGFETLAAVAAEQKGQVCLAPVLLVPVALRLSVFYPVIPVYKCLILAGL